MSRNSIRIVGVGDVMLGRGVAALGKDAASLLAADVSSRLVGDVVTGNLECVVTERGRPNPFSHAHFRAKPEHARGVVRRFHVLSLANNHVGDFGDEAIEDTLRFLDAEGIGHVGVGTSVEEAVAPVRMMVEGRTVSIFGATTVGNMQKGSRFWLALPDDDLWAAVREAKQAGDYCVLHLHAGGGDFKHPSPRIRALMRRAVDVGFDVVFGHHPHIIQGWQSIGESAVFYALGDFVFDRLDDGRRLALIAVIVLTPDGGGPTVDVVPVVRGADLVVALPGPTVANSIRQELEELSKNIVSGRSDAAYRRWFGSPLSRLFWSVRKDFQVGGLAAIFAKLARMNLAKILDIFWNR